MSNIINLARRIEAMQGALKPGTQRLNNLFIYQETDSEGNVVLSAEDQARYNACVACGMTCILLPAKKPLDPPEGYLA